MSDHRFSRATAFVAPVRKRSFAVVLGAAAVALSLGASVALQWIDGAPVPAPTQAVVDVVPPPAPAAVPATTQAAADVVPPSAPTAVPATIEPASPKDRAGPPESEPSTFSQNWPDRTGDRAARADPRGVNSTAALDVDVVPPAAAAPSVPVAAEMPKRVESASAAVATLAGAAAGGAAIAAAAPKRANAGKTQAVPLPRPAPPAEIRAAANTPAAKPDKDPGRRQAFGSYRKRGPLKLIGMLFGGWRN